MEFDIFKYKLTMTPVEISRQILFDICITSKNSTFQRNSHILYFYLFICLYYIYKFNIFYFFIYLVHSIFCILNIALLKLWFCVKLIRYFTRESNFKKINAIYIHVSIVVKYIFTHKSTLSFRIIIN